MIPIGTMKQIRNFLEFHLKDFDFFLEIQCSAEVPPKFNDAFVLVASIVQIFKFRLDYLLGGYSQKKYNC